MGGVLSHGWLPHRECTKRCNSDCHGYLYVTFSLTHSQVTSEWPFRSRDTARSASVLRATVHLGSVLRVLGAVCKHVDLYSSCSADVLKSFIRSSCLITSDPSEFSSSF